MRPIFLLGKSLLYAICGILLLAIVLALFLTARAMSGSQTDDVQRMAGKQAYLDTIRQQAAPDRRHPNIIFILYDDMGYGDIGAGAVGNLIDTPHIDRLAQGGVTLTDFHSPAPVCTPSRAGFLTGRLAPRAGLPDVLFPTGSNQELIFAKILNPRANRRLPAEEITVAEILRAAGYATGMIGKWHLGDRSPSLPNDMGFDDYFGALYSNDMQPFALYRNGAIEQQAPVDQRLLTASYTREAVAFVEKNRDQSFFLYFAHNFPHDPLAASDERRGRSDAGLYGDVLEEIDDGVGEIVAALERGGNLDNTLIIITSDNGPWFLGNAGDQRGRKGNTFEGGMRVPFIAHWPGTIPAQRSENAMSMGTDLLPTILEILQLQPPQDRTLDGRSILQVLTSGAPTPHDYLYYFDGDTLFAVRDQRFKYRGAAGVLYATDAMPFGADIPQKEWLFDLQGDPRESYDTSGKHSQPLARLRKAFEAKQKDMKDNLRGWR